MMILFRVLCFGLFAYFPVESYSQPGIDFLLWNERGGMIENATLEPVIPRLEEHWHERLLPSMLSVRLNIHAAKTDSLQYFRQMIERMQPACLEGEPAFVEYAVNPHRQMKYIPVLQSSHPLAAELVFRSPSPNWEAVLGVVHPSYSAGGRLQIAYWEAQQEFTPKTVAFDTTHETLLHLMVGSVQAAAVPHGALERFLGEQNRMDLLDRFHRIKIENPLPAVMIYLRQDWYEDTLRRTLISETWLRDCFPERLRIVPQPVSYF